MTLILVSGSNVLLSQDWLYCLVTECKLWNLELGKTFELFKQGLMDHKCGNVEGNVAKNNVYYECLNQKVSVVEEYS